MLKCVFWIISLKNSAILFSFLYSLTLIVVSEDDNADDCHLGNVLSYVFDTMVMLLGFDDVTNIKNVERFKKDVRVSVMLYYYSASLRLLHVKIFVLETAESHWSAHCTVWIWLIALHYTEELNIAKLA